MTKLSENKLMLLAIGINRHGILRSEDAYKIYSNTESAHSALQSLRAWGYIRFHDIGVFRVVKAPPEAFTVAENLKEETEERFSHKNEDEKIKKTDDKQGLEEIEVE